mgnify:CR=1 FL=1
MILVAINFSDDDLQVSIPREKMPFLVVVLSTAEGREGPVDQAKITLRGKEGIIMLDH